MSPDKKCTETLPAALITRELGLEYASKRHTIYKAFGEVRNFPPQRSLRQLNSLPQYIKRSIKIQ